MLLARRAQSCKQLQALCPVVGCCCSALPQRSRLPARSQKHGPRPMHCHPAKASCDRGLPRAHLRAALHLLHRRLVAVKVGHRRLGHALGQLLAPGALGKLGLNVCGRVRGREWGRQMRRGRATSIWAARVGQKTPRWLRLRGRVKAKWRKKGAATYAGLPFVLPKVPACRVQLAAAARHCCWAEPNLAPCCPASRQGPVCRSALSSSARCKPVAG